MAKVTAEQPWLGPEEAQMAPEPTDQGASNNSMR